MCTNSLPILEFCFNNEGVVQNYAMEVIYAEEVYALRHITNIPCTPDFIIGIMNFRGKILSVIDIRKFLGFTTKSIHCKDVEKTIIVKVDEVILAIAIDDVIGYKVISLEQIQKDISTLTNTKADYFKGITDKGMIVLNMRNILMDKRIIINEQVN